MGNVLVHETKSEVCGKMAGVVTLPTDFDPATEKLPVIVFLHGAGERGDGSAEKLEWVKVHGIPKYFCADPDYKGLRVITLSPQCPFDMVWNHLVHPLMQWILDAVKTYGGDESRIAITGLSMGGFGTWDMMMTYPEHFCCGAPICGGGAAWRAGDLKGKPIWAFHGIDDGVVSLDYSLMMVGAAKANGAEAFLTTFDCVGHGSWNPAFANTNLVEWLASGGTLPRIERV